MFFCIKLIGKFLLVFSFVFNIAGCGPLISKPNLVKNSANGTFDEKPDILDISAAVIWDGGQTLGGNWVSHPDVDSPERVLIKNNSNGKSVVGAVFQQTKKMKTGSALVSSDAAKALDIAQNKQTKVQIVAIRVPESTAVTRIITKTNPSESASLETKLSKPLIQVGIFGVQKNANKTKDQMSKLSLPANILDFQIKGKPYWRVVVGPASTSDSRENMLKDIKSAGFTDAYYVSN